MGEGYLKSSIENGGLRPDHNILDVGCGIGRVAIPLTKFLSPTAKYEGLDIVPHGIRWCQKRITPRFPNFNFTLADIKNSLYNPSGKLSASDFKFPYKDNSFDFVLLLSVFTHMVQKDMENYHGEIARVLKPGGKCYGTYFLLNEESIKLNSDPEANLKVILQTEPGTPLLDFKPTDGKHWTVDKDCPGVAVAYQEDYIRDLNEKLGMKICEPIISGSWCGRKAGWLQDVIFSEKSRN